MDITPIRTEVDYETALAEIERLMEAEPGTPEEAKLDVLATLVKVYEDEHHALPLPDPIVALEYYLESRGLTRKALEPYIGPAHRVTEIMNRRRRLTLTMIRRLEQGTDIPATVLVKPYELVPSSRPAHFLTEGR
jgi:HTH-type transcriptional regulator / antitoxin HigA